MRYSNQVDATYFKNKGKEVDPIFNLRVSESKKYADDCRWFKDYMEWVIPSYYHTMEEYDELKILYDVYNDNLEGFKDILNKFCNKLGINIGQLEDEVMAFPKLHNKGNVLKGEYIKRNTQLKAVLLSAKAIKDKNKQMFEAIRNSVEEKVQIELDKMKLELEGMSAEEANQMVESLRKQEEPADILHKDFLSEWEIFLNKAIKYCEYDQRIKSKGLETLEDAIISDRFFVYSGWRFGKPYIEIRNPLYTGFEKASNEKFVNKGNWVWYRKPITIDEVYTNYADKLTEEEMDRLGISVYANNFNIDKRHSLGPHEQQYVFDHTTEELFSQLNRRDTGYEDKRIGTHQANGMKKNFSRDSYVWETHFEFKAFRELVYLSYIDEYNKKVSMFMRHDFKIPKEAKKVEFINKWGEKSHKYTWVDELTQTEYEAEKLWIPRKYEVIRLGNDIYPICREVPYQTTNINNPYSEFDLSTFGAVLTARNAHSVSLLKRALPSYFQYLFVKHIQNRELAKYQGYIQDIDVDQIPSELGQDIDGQIINDPIAVWMWYRKYEGINYYSGSQTTTGGLPPSTRSPGSRGAILGTAQEIYNLQLLADILDREIGMAMGISPQREAQFTNNSNVGDNQQAITQSHHITEPYFYYISEVWGQVIYDYVKNFITYCRMLKEENGENPIFHYILPDGTSELLEVTPKMLEPIDFGLFVVGDSDRRYQEMMLQLSHAFAQNAGEGMESVSAILKAITSGMSSEETHKMIKIEADKQRQRMQQQQEAQTKAAKELEMMKIKEREDIQEHEIEKILVKGQVDERLKALDIFKFTEDKNQDQDGIPDYIEAYKAIKTMQQKDRDLDIKEKKLAIDKKKANSKNN
jgi:hypothetical protein